MMKRKLAKYWVNSLFFLFVFTQCDAIKQEKILQEGNKFLELNEYQLAINQYNEILKTNRYYYKAFNNRGIAYMKMGLYLESFQDFQYTILIKPDFAEAYLNKAEVLEYLKRFNESIQSIDQARALGADETECDFRLALIQYQQGQYQNSIPYWKKAIASKKFEADGIINLCMSYYFLNQSDSMKFWLDQYSAKMSQNPEFWNAKGLYHFQKNEWKIAIENYQQGLSLANTHPFLHFNLIQSALIYGDTALAIRYWNQSKILFPNHEASNNYDFSALN